MENKDRDHNAKQSQLEEHSLPGTNQAGKGAEECETSADDSRMGGRESEREAQLEEHSLPGTNQAGKGAAE